VARNSEKLADMLTDKALEGDLPSTKVLVALSEQSASCRKPVKKWRGLTLTQRLAAEPPWEGPPEGSGERNWDLAASW
jgi:hypothetical protein